MVLRLLLFIYFLELCSFMVMEKFKKMFKTDNKGQAVTLTNLLPTVVLFAVAILATSLITDVVQSVRDDQTADTAAANVSDNGLTGMTNLSGQFGNLGTIIAIVVIIGLLVSSFVVFRRQ